MRRAGKNVSLSAEEKNQDNRNACANPDGPKGEAIKNVVNSGHPVNNHTVTCDFIRAYYPPVYQPELVPVHIYTRPGADLLDLVIRKLSGANMPPLKVEHLAGLTDYAADDKLVILHEEPVSLQTGRGYSAYKFHAPIDPDTVSRAQVYIFRRIHGEAQQASVRDFAVENEEHFYGTENKENEHNRKEKNIFSHSQQPSFWSELVRPTFPVDRVYLREMLENFRALALNRVARIFLSHQRFSSKQERRIQ